MKYFSITLILLIATLSSFVEAAPVNARYVKFEGYYSSVNGYIGIHEIEVYANGLNAAKGKIATINSGYYPERLTDGNKTGVQFLSNQNDPGPASDAVPHWIRLDLGSDLPIDRIQIYFGGSTLYSYGLLLSSDGINWTQVSRNDLATGTVQNDPSAPFVKIESAAMRAGTTYMDVVYRVTDPDDTTVKTRALAFVDGVRSFANVLKPVTFVEGTAAKLGDTITVNQSHTITWDVGADWLIDLGQVKFEVLAMDGRRLLPMDWIAIPAAGAHPQTTVSKNSPTNAEVLNALFWRYADGDTGLTLANGILSGNASNGEFNNVPLANGSTVQLYAPPFLFKRMNLDVDDGVVATVARAGVATPQGWHAINRPYAGVPMVVSWGSNSQGQINIPAGLSGVNTMVAAGWDFSLALKSDGTVVGWGHSKATPPAGLTGVTAITAGGNHSLALKSDGTVVGWGSNDNGQITPPAGLVGVISVDAGHAHSLALKSDGTVVGWGLNNYDQIIIPAGLSGVIAIAAGYIDNIALKSDGTVVGWGGNSYGLTTIPAGLSGVTAISLGHEHCLALKSDGTVVGWGRNNHGQTTIPSGLSGVTAISAGIYHSMALKSDGTVVSWGYNYYGQTTIPTGLTAVSAISAGGYHNLILKAKAP
jgi:Regulator of chromosome condensation (RCC1) repeat/F5/8 type C domain